jgi:hypothetical protein
VAAAVDDPVDLGGIGKGLALRWAWRTDCGRAHHARVRAPFEAGGDLSRRGRHRTGSVAHRHRDPGSRLAGSGGADIGSGGADIGSGGADIGSESGVGSHVAVITV